MGKSMNKSGKLLPQLTFFCTIARDGERKKPKPFSQVQFTQYNIAASACTPLTVKLGWVVSGCHLCLAQRCLLSPTLLSCFTRAVTGTTLNTALGADLRVPKTQLQRIHPNSPL